MATITTNSRHYADIADAIRAKGIDGTFLPSQMASAISGMQLGSNALSSDYYTIKSKVVTVGANTVSTPLQAAQYFSAAVGSSVGVVGWSLVGSEYSNVNNQSITHLTYFNADSGETVRFYYRIRDGAISTLDHFYDYALKLVEGTDYCVLYLEQRNIPSL